MTSDEESKTTSMRVRVSESLKANLKSEAEATDRSMSDLIREGAKLAMGDTRKKLERKLRRLQDDRMCVHTEIDQLDQKIQDLEKRKRSREAELEEIESEIDEVKEQIEAQGSQQDLYNENLKNLAEEAKQNPDVITWDGELRKAGEPLNLAVKDVREDLLTQLGVDSVEDAREKYGDGYESSVEEDPFAELLGGEWDDE